MGKDFDSDIWTFLNDKTWKNQMNDYESDRQRFQKSESKKKIWRKIIQSIKQPLFQNKQR